MQLQPGSTWLPMLIVTSLVLTAQGEGVYSESSEVCCDGKVLPRSDGSGCCNGQLYNTSTDLCCGPNSEVQLLPLPNPDIRLKEGRELTTTYSCCGQQAIDDHTHICCDGKAVPKLFSDTGCCGPKAYDVGRFICCGNGFLFRRQGNIATKGRISQCCGNKGYDPKRFLCCGGKLERIWSIATAACCGNEPFDIGSQGCCGGRPFDDPFGLIGCCGNATYEHFVEICCNGKVFSDPMRSRACCGDMPYDPNNETCCDGGHLSSTVKLLSKRDKCCGELSYDPSTHMCCNHTVNPRKSAGSECCGNVTYDRGVEECCGGHTVTTSLPAANTNILSDRPSDTRLACCKGQVTKLTKGNKLCC